MRNFKRIMAIGLALTLCGSTLAWASTGKYLALGEDLTDSQQATVLKLLGVDNIEDCDTIYISNSEEHQYLDGKVDSSEIGTQSLSSVLIEENDSDEINVTTYNINYCTEGMYRNALATAGVKGADVYVAGPYEISGTAALVGTVKLYEEMTGETVDDDVIDGSVEELTTTGEVGDEVGDKEGVEEVVAAVKEEMADDPDMSSEEIADSISDAAGDAGVSLTDEQIQKLADMLEQLEGLDIDWSNIKSQSSSLLSDLGSKLSNIDTDKAESLITQFINWIKGLF